MKRKQPPGHLSQLSAAPPHRPFRLALFLLAVAFCTSLYLGFVVSQAALGIGCGPLGDCAAVLESRWSRWLRLPVAWPAAVVYLSLGICTLYLTRPPPKRKLEPVWLLSIFLSLTIIGASAWFVGLQLFDLGHFCLPCLITHTAGTAAAVLVLWASPLRRTAGRLEMITSQDASKAATAAIFSLFLLIVGQFALDNPLHTVAAIPAQPPGAPLDAKPAPGTLSLHQGKFQLPLDQVPLRGNPSAPVKIVSLFDYTCHHCRDLHGHLRQAEAALTGQLSLVALPMPLNAACNDYLKSTPEAHRLACHYARLSLAVWSGRPDLFPAFDDWLFEHPQLPSPDEAQARAASLISDSNLRTALESSQIDRLLELSTSLYAENYRQTGTAQMPQLIIGNVVSAGPLQSVQDLYKLLEEHAGLKVP